jgi:hypothetical protein
VSVFAGLRRFYTAQFRQLSGGFMISLSQYLLKRNQKMASLENLPGK